MSLKYVHRNNKKVVLKLMKRAIEGKQICMMSLFRHSIPNEGCLHATKKRKSVGVMSMNVYIYIDRLKRFCFILNL